MQIKIGFNRFFIFLHILKGSSNQHDCNFDDFSKIDQDRFP